MYRPQKRIPTLLGLFIIAAGILGLSFGDRALTTYVTLADPTQQPKEIKISNISDTSFTVSWITEKNTLGSVLLKRDNKTIVAIDDLDLNTKLTPRTLHYVTLKSLSPKATYSFVIQTGNVSCSLSNKCPSLDQKTFDKPVEKTDQLPIYGTVVDSKNKPQSGNLVFLKINDSPLLSTHSDSLGKWVVPLTMARTKSGDQIKSITDSDIIQATSYSSINELGSIFTDGETLISNREMPPIKIGTAQNPLGLNRPSKFTATQKILGDTDTQSSETGITILFPYNDYDQTSDYRPRLRGTSYPDKIVTLLLNPGAITGRSRADKTGKWEWRPSKALSPGKYTLTIKTPDLTNKIISVSKSFIVQKSGESVLGDATPSGALTPTLVQTASPTPTIPTTLSPTILPTIEITITVTPTLTITPTLTPTLAIPTNTQAPPGPPGETAPTALIILGSASFFIIGIKLLLF